MFWGTYNGSYVEGLYKPGKSCRDSNLKNDDRYDYQWLMSDTTIHWLPRDEATFKYHPPSFIG